MNRPTIALAMIVKNESRNLANLLKSVEGCFDEIHITDTGSTDNTVEIARRHGAHVHHFEWCDDFSVARNASFEPVKTDFVMWLDGDDVLMNKEMFLLWRDDVMGLADYWLATYHYSWDETGTMPLCSFARERVFRTSKEMKWKYFIHEGVVPNAPNIKAEFITTWAVRHCRTAEDLANDKSRNLKIFEKHRMSLDARMQYYYGKELFENNKTQDACQVLQEAIKNPQLEFHDRILATQYLAFGLSQYAVLDEKNINAQKLVEAIKVCHDGLQLVPHRAELHCCIGDAYLRLNQPNNAIPSYNAAKACVKIDATRMLSPIFSNEVFYTVYPRNQLTRVYGNMGRLDLAEAEANEALNKWPNKESEELLKEVRRIASASRVVNNAKECDDIVISCPPQNAYEWDSEIAKTKGMGGSETAAIELSQQLKALTGRNVKIFNVRAQDNTYDGIEYIDNKKIHEYFQHHKPWLHIAWRHNIELTDARTLVWSHDLITQGAENYRNFDKILALTPFHKRFLQVKQGIPENKIHVFRNGIRPERFKNVASVKKNPNKLVFTSSPDRGLDRAMRVMDKVRVKYPDAELHVFYGLDNLYKFGLADMAERFKQMMAERPWVKYHGFTQQEKLMEHLAESVVWVHPCDFIETFCITALEMLCSKVYPVTRRLGGLADTLAKAEAEGMATLLNSDCISDAEYQLYIDAVIDALDNKKWEKVSVDPESFSWKSVTQELLNDLPKLVE